MTTDLPALRLRWPKSRTVGIFITVAIVSGGTGWWAMMRQPQPNLSTQDLLPGMFGRLQLRRLTGGHRLGLMIPELALVKQFGVTGVFIVVDRLAQFQPITTGQVQGEVVEVFSGLEVGDLVIVNPTPSLENGTAVRVS